MELESDLVVLILNDTKQNLICKSEPTYVPTYVNPNKYYLLVYQGFAMSHADASNSLMKR